MRKIFSGLLLVAVVSTAVAQQRPGNPNQTPGNAVATPGARPAAVARQEPPKPYREVITEKAISHPGLFTVHRVEDKWYFEIPDSILGRDILVSTRYGKTAAGGNYGGEQVNLQTIRWEKGPSHTLFMKVLTIVNVATDSSQPIAQAVSNSNMNPIAAAFDVRAYGKSADSTSGTTVIEVTDFFKGDNQPVSLTPAIKRRFNLAAVDAPRSYIESIRTYPINTEIRTVKTFTAAATPPATPAVGGRAPAGPLAAAEVSGAVTVELNNSFYLLPKTPMRRRLLDPRVGFFASHYTTYGDDQQRVEETEFIHHWRLEPKDEDIEKWKRGELVEPKKQIVYYIDPATPKKWRPYLIAGINDWQVAFEKAGFKNAIVGKEWPENDRTMSLEDARFSVIRYFASDIENAYGPNVADPRSGEILESHIGWYHNVMKLVHDWYMIQTAAVDPRARRMKFDDALMGDLIRFVSSHEVGHTLGLRHNMGSSSKTPVEKLRDKAWVEANGHTASIMDYARFNYVAQPEDNITSKGLYPRIGDYDKWAIMWGYKGIPDTKDEEEDKKILNKWAIDSLKNPRLWFGGEGQNFDPRAQTEDLSDNAMKASEYGIKNLKRILPNLPEWCREEADRYDNLEEMYQQVVGQFARYMGHVVKNVGGVQETFKSVEQPGDVYEATPKSMQKEAVGFLVKNLYVTPTWLLNKDILNKFANPGLEETVSTVQALNLKSLLSPARLYRLDICAGRFGSSAYSVDDLLTDAKKGVWSELAPAAPIDIYRRKLQKEYIADLIILIGAEPPPPAPAAALPRGFNVFTGDIRNTDVPSAARAQLVELRTEISGAIPRETDKASKNHLQDVQERIKQALNPKP